MPMFHSRAVWSMEAVATFTEQCSGRGNRNEGEKNTRNARAIHGYWNGYHWLSSSINSILSSTLPQHEFLAYLATACKANCSSHHLALSHSTKHARRKKGSLKLSSKYLPQCPPAAYYAPEFSRARSFQMQRHPAQKSSLISFSLAKKENEEHFFSMCLRNYPAPANRDNLSEMAGVSAKSMIRSSDFARAVEFLTHALHGGIAAPVACFKAR